MNKKIFVLSLLSHFIYLKSPKKEVKDKTENFSVGKEKGHPWRALYITHVRGLNIENSLEDSIVFISPPRFNLEPSLKFSTAFWLCFCNRWFEVLAEHSFAYQQKIKPMWCDMM